LDSINIATAESIHFLSLNHFIHSIRIIIHPLLSIIQQVLQLKKENSLQLVSDSDDSTHGG
jgi:hypothetical protein